MGKNSDRNNFASRISVFQLFDAQIWALNFAFVIYAFFSLNLFNFPDVEMFLGFQCFTSVLDIIFTFISLLLFQKLCISAINLQNEKKDMIFFYLFRLK